RVGLGGRSVPGKSTARDKYSAIDCHSNLSVVGSKIWAQTSTVVPAWCGTRFCAQVEIRTGWSIGTSDICQTLCCRCTMPSNGNGKRRSAIIAVDKPKAVMCTVTEGAEFWPTTPEEPSSALYSSTSRREITSVVSHRVPGRLDATDCLARSKPVATLPYEDVSDGISLSRTTRRFS